MYLEGGLEVTVPGMDVTLTGRLGYQWIERNARFGAPDYLAYSVSVSRPIAHGVAISAGWYGTDISQAECGGLKICDGRFIAALSWTFWAGGRVTSPLFGQSTGVPDDNGWRQRYP